MADERNETPDNPVGHDGEDAETRAQLDALKAEEEREALQKAREHQDSAVSGEENENGLGNLHYGDEARGDYLKDAGGPEGGDSSSGLKLDDTPAPPTARSDVNDGEAGAASAAGPEGGVPDNGGGDDAPTEEPADGLRDDELLAGGLEETGARLARAGAPGGEGRARSADGAANDGDGAAASAQTDAAREDDELVLAQVNDAPTDILLSNDTVFENEEGAVVLTLSAVDPDANDTVSFSIAEDPSGYFEIVGDALRLKEGVALDYEAQNAFQVTIVAADEEGATYQETVTIKVADANDAPEALTLSNVNVAENDAGAVIGNLSVTDQDVGDSHDYAVSDDRFEVVDGQLKLKDGVSLDHEAGDSVSVIVTATDAGGLQTDATFDIAVGDVNEAPEGLALSSASVAENDAGAVIGDLSLTDVDDGDSHDYAVSDDRFEVVDGQLKLKNGVSLDHEAGDSVSVTVTATDAGCLETEATFDIAVGDVNEAPEALTLSNVNVAENDAGAVIGDLSLTDVDDGDSHDYAVSDDRFEVVGGQLKLKDGVSLDHEAGESVSVIVTATDAGGLQTDAAFEIVVGDVNEAPTEIALSGDSVDENDAGAVVATLTSSDPDAGDTAAYAIADDPSGLFEVVGDQLKLKDGVSLDHEGQDSYDLTLKVTDGEGASHQETVTINVADVNEAPIDIEVSTQGEGAFLEQGGRLVIEAENFDANNAGNNGHEWGDSTFDGAVHVDDGAVFNNIWRTQTDVENNAPELTYQVRFDTPGEYYVHIRGAAEDGPRGNADSVHIGLDGERLTGDGGLTGLNGGLSWGSRDTLTGQRVTITVDEPGTYALNLWAREDGVAVDKIVLTQDPDYAPSGEGPAESPRVGDTGVLAENAAEGTVVATLTAVDPDAGDAHVFEIVDGDGNPVADDNFEIVGNEIRVKAGANLDFETDASHALLVRATDAAGESYVETVEINLEDVNEAATDIELSNDTVSEGEVGAVVATLSSNDPDAGDTATYTITDDPSGAFEIVGDQLKLKDGVSLNHEDAAEREVTIEVTDSAGNAYRETVTINVEDVNSAPVLGVVSGGNGLEASYFDVGRSIRNLDEVDFDAAPDATGVVGGLNYMTGNEAFWDGGPDNFFAAKYEGRLVVEEGGSYTLSLASDDGSQLFINGRPVIDNDGLHGTRTRTVTLDLDAGSHDIEVRYFENGGQQTLQLTWSGPDTGGVNRLIEGDAFQHGVNADNLSLPEDTPGAVVAALSVSDADAGDTHVFDVSDDRFEVVEVDGAPTLKLKDGVSIDHETEGSVNVAVTVTDAAGDSDAADFTIAVNDVNSAPTIGLAGMSGLQASYYDIGSSISRLSDIDFDGAPDATGVVESLNYRTGDERFWDGGADDFFAAKYEGELIVQEGGSYTLNLASDDGSQLFINGQPVIDNDGLHGTRTRTVTLDLEPGAHAIEIRYFENTGAQTLQLTWSGPDTGGATELVEGDALQQPGTYGVDTGAVAENDPGAVAALLAATDADGDALAFTVNDDRFEVVETDAGPVLKLKDGVSLDYETDQQVTVTVTATDPHGESASADVTVNVADVDDGPAPIAGATQGADRLNGTGEADLIDGLAGDDRLNGGGGDDTIIGGAGDDTMNGGDGDDVFVVSGDDQGFDRFNGGRGDDAIIAGEDGAVIGVSRFGNNVETISADGHSGVTIAGDAANNNLNFSGTTLDGIEAIDGGAGNDRITGSRGDDVILGGEGRDNLRGGAGADRLDGGAGDDRLFGQGGDDIIVGGAGDDTMNGGGGDDVFVVTGTGDGFDRISGGGGNDAIVAGVDNTEIGLSAFNNSVETISADGREGVTIQGGAGNNTFNFSRTTLDGVEAIDGGDGNDRITGSTGDDVIRGGEGRDDLRGGDGDDRLEGDGGNDRLRGQDGDDTLIGGEGDDRLEGGDGADVLIGGLGDDTLTGGAGDDVFVYAEGDGSDVVRAGGGDWTDVIQFDGGIEALGEFGVDWTVELTRGSIDSVNADRIDLSQNADGVITLNDGSTIEFQDVEQII